MHDPRTGPELEEAAGPAAGAVSIRAMGLRSILALALLAMLSVGSYALVRKSLRAQETAAAVVRISAHQRLLFDRILVLSFRLLNSYDVVAARERMTQILAAADELERSHEALMSGRTTAAAGSELSPDVRAIYSGPPIFLDRTIRRFLEHGRNLAAHRGDDLIWSKEALIANVFAISSTPILEDLSQGLDALVGQFQSESDARIRDTQRLEIAVVATTILVLLSMGLFVFRPMIVRVRLDIEDLRRVGDELKARAEALERSNAELEQFAYVASHDLQEPLRMIAAYVQLLERRYRGKLGADADECIHYASEGATRMHRLILDLLAFSRVGTHGGALLQTDLAEILRGVLDDMQVAIGEAGATVTSSGLPRLRVDPLQLGQLFQNLIANAIKFRGEEPPRIRVEAREEAEEWHFSVGDNGIGFDMRFAERIFVIFQRLHARDRYPGTGIGLAICKKIVERHGGRIWAESNSGRGSTFHFTLPKRD